ncbi:MAG TPA: polyprenyl synthetase family protein [Pyrinomonadaceae bacterium]|nr:polyprenyl synthetase family protein [Pyrinomonadaceae bacterium]
MQNEEFTSFVLSQRQRIEEALNKHLPVSAAPGAERLNEALSYAVFPGGKRLRPHMTLAAARLGGVTDHQALLLACAIEYIHTSSLVLDDLPSMDDADVRRNKPALHIEFGEGMAILTGVALLNQAYVLFASAASGTDNNGLQRLIHEAGDCIGSGGMIAGQATELALSGVPADAVVLVSRELKTRGLMRLMMVAGGVLADADHCDVDALGTFGECLGSAFQIYDDLGDMLGDRQLTGKSVGQDLRHLRPTAVRNISSEESRQLASEVIESGKTALARFGDREEAALLRSAADFIVAAMGLGVATSDGAPGPHP